MEGCSATHTKPLALEVHATNMAPARLQVAVSGVQEVRTLAAVDVAVSDARRAFEVTVASAGVRVHLRAAAEKRNSASAEVVLAVVVVTVALLAGVVHDDGAPFAATEQVLALSMGAQLRAVLHVAVLHILCRRAALAAELRLRWERV